MKTSLFRNITLPAIIAVCSVCLPACQKKGVSYTPYISFSAFMRNPVFSNDSIVGFQDTVHATYDSSLGGYLLDTITLKDTVAFMVGFGSRGNDLVAALVTYDSAALRLTCNLEEAIQDVLTEETDQQALQLYFEHGYNFVLFPVTYTARVAGTHKMGFKVESDSQSSPQSYALFQPVKE